MRRAVRWVWLLVLSLCATAGAHLHPANIPTARAKVGLDGSVELRLRFDMLAYVLDETPVVVADAPMNALLDGSVEDLDAGLRDARERMRHDLQVLGEGKGGTIDSIVFPTAAEVHAAADHAVPRLPVMMAVVVKAHLPIGARTCSFRFPDVLGTVVLTTEFPYEEPVSEPVDPGAASSILTLPTAAQVASVQAEIKARSTPPALEAKALLALKPADSREATVLGRGIASIESSGLVLAVDRRPPTRARMSPVAAAAPAPLIRNEGPPWVATLPSYVRMGFVHIVPNGLDHILFVLGLFLLSRRTKDLVKQVTAFTIAHSITLGLSLYGVIRLPSTVVEPIIAASIVFVAVENILTTELKKWRVGVVFLFGLVHGLGFATALQDAGLQRSDFLTALVGFNCGVELGQLSVVAAALLLVGWFRSHQRYRPMVAIPASAAIALIAAVWTIERLF